MGDLLVMVRRPKGALKIFLEHSLGPDSHIPFYSRIYFDYDLQEANGVEYCTRRDVMRRNIGCRSLYWDEKGYSGKRN